MLIFFKIKILDPNQLFRDDDVFIASGTEKILIKDLSFDAEGILLPEFKS